ncbi:hypothetical protein Plhal703r1_c05g0030381 [Plasmopara halstedii]
MASVVPLPLDIDDLPSETLTEVPNVFANSQEVQRSIKRAGQALINAFDLSSFSSECQGAVATMAASGHALELRFSDEIKTAGGLTVLSQHCTLRHLADVRIAIADCATATKFSPPVVELLSLWSVVHTSVTDVLTQVTLLSAPIFNNGSEILQTLEHGEENAKAIGKFLATALTSSDLLALTSDHELIHALHHLVETGQPIADDIVLKYHQHMANIRKLLSDHDWNIFQSHCLKPLNLSLLAIDSTIVEQAKEVTTLIIKTSNDVFDSPYTKLIVTQGFASLDEVFSQNRDVVDAALETIRNGGTSTFGVVATCLSRSGFPSLLRVEIVRDFFQTVSLFFAGLYVSVLDSFNQYQFASKMNSFLDTLHSLYDVMAINLVALIERTSQSRAWIAEVAVWILLAAITIVYGSFLWFAFSGRHLHRRADEVRQGHEALTWALLAEKQKMRVRIFTIIITACLTVYLPLTRLCFDIVIAAATTHSNDDKNQGINASKLLLSRFQHDPAWPVFVVIAILLLITFTIPLPYLLIRAIAENRPTGSLENPLVTYDLDGEMVPFDDKVYARLVSRDPSQLRCPYRSLYAGFEQRWSYYKVLQLIVKLALAFGIALTTNSDVQIRGIISCSIYSTVVVISGYGTPFTDPLNNVMEISGKVTALITCVGGVIVAFIKTDQKLLQFITVFVSVVHILNLIVMLLVLLLGMNGFRLIIKNLLGWITFSDPSRGLEDVSAKSILPRWDIDKQVKYRVWQAFWRSLFLTMTQNTTIKPGEVTVVQRLETLEQAVVASGIQRVRLHWHGDEDSYISKLRLVARAALEGVDVFWDDATGARDGILDSKSCFGKMYVRPYPFHCIMVYDDSKDETIIRDEADSFGHSTLAKFLSLNFSSRILAKRALRQKLRVLSTKATAVNFPFTRQEQVTVDDGTITRTDSEGNTHTETRYSTVTFTCSYTCGVLHVTTRGDNSKRIMAEGFDVTMSYRDGRGDAVAPHTKKVHHLENRVAIMGMDHIGLTYTMEESEQLQMIFEQTRDVWIPGVIELQKHYQDYRNGLDRKHSQANSTLSDAFWFFVYNNPHISRQELQNHFTNREGNPRLQSLVKTHESSLDSLYLRMKYIYSHPAVTFWFVFWEDVYARNGNMKRIKAFKADFDPNQTTAICYHVMQRPDLEVWLKKRHLLGKRRFFHTHLLDRLFIEMDNRLASGDVNSVEGDGLPGAVVEMDVPCEAGVISDASVGVYIDLEVDVLSGVSVNGGGAVGMDDSGIIVDDIGAGVMMGASVRVYVDSGVDGLPEVE